jgi:transposase-like protein
MSRPTRTDERLLRRIYVEEQRTISEIAALFGVDYSTMRKRLLRCGVQLRNRKEARILSSQRQGKPGELGADFFVREYVERGRTTVDIARELGIASNTVLHHMRKAGITPRPRKDRMKRVWSDERFRQHMGRDQSASWNGGVTKNNGYVQVHMPDHPDADARGYVFQHRLVMERMVGRRLRPEERVHHKNHVKTDNRPENLELFAGDLEHAEHHVLEQRANHLAGTLALRAFETWIGRCCV